MSEFKPISERDIYELFTLVLAYPWYLVEGHPTYKEIKQNIVKRFEQLKKEHDESKTT
jgi:hypothetical protein